MKRNYPFKKFLLVCAAVTAVFGIFAAIILLRARPMIYQTAVSNAESLSLKLTDMAVAEVLDGERISYGDIVELTADDAGAVKSLEIDPREINLLKTEISSKVSELVAKNSECPVTLPLGTIIGGDYINGLGPRLHFPMQITATAYVNFKSNFTAAGINQVLHQILIEIKVEGVVLSAASRYPFSTQTSAIAAQSVIVGAVPDAFTNVIEYPGNDTAGWIFDYGHLE